MGFIFTNAHNDKDLGIYFRECKKFNNLYTNGNLVGYSRNNPLKLGAVQLQS